MNFRRPGRAANECDFLGASVRGVRLKALRTHINLGHAKERHRSRGGAFRIPSEEGRSTPIKAPMVFHESINGIHWARKRVHPNADGVYGSIDGKR